MGRGTRHRSGVNRGLLSTPKPYQDDHKQAPVPVSVSPNRFSLLAISPAKNNSEHMVAPVCISTPSGSLNSYALVDTGASVNAIGFDFAHLHKLPLTKLARPMYIENADGSANINGAVTHKTKLTFTIQEHLDTDVEFMVTKLDHYPMYLGIPWLRHHNPTLDFHNSELTFDSNYCSQNCFQQSPKVTMIPAAEVDADVPTRKNAVKFLQKSKKRTQSGNSEKEFLRSQTLVSNPSQVQKNDRRTIVPEEYHEFE